MAQEEINTKKKTRPKPLSETRKIRKPLMERKRRERINTSLNELAKLLMDSQKVKIEEGKAAKLEKADILELTVKHLQSLHNNQDTAARVSNIANDDKYHEGFRECIRVVEKALKKTTPEDLKERLLTHLSGRLKTLRASHKRRFTEEKKEENDARLLHTKKEEELKKNQTESIRSMSEKYSFALVPTELPDGGVAFILTGNPQILLKEWKNLAAEATLASQEVNSEVESPYSMSPNISEFTNSPQILPNGQIPNTTETAKCTFPASPQHSFATHPCTSSIANQTLSFESNKTCHTLKPLSQRLSCSFSIGSRSSPRPQANPPTPPPSPPNKEGERNIAPSQTSHRLPQGVEGVIIQEMGLKQDFNEPFDLRVIRIWRPW